MPVAPACYMPHLHDIDMIILLLDYVLVATPRIRPEMIAISALHLSFAHWFEISR